MFTFLKKHVVVFGLMVAVGSLSLFGCGHSPVVSDAQDPGINSQEVSYIAFSPSAAFRAAKYTDGGEVSVSQVFGPAGGDMMVEDLGDAGAQDDLKATFEVKSGGLNEDVEISMALTRGTMSQLVATFAPCGLNFNTDSELQFIVGNELVDLDLSSLTVYHIHGDGTVETAGMSVEMAGDYTIVHVNVPGFSRYDLDP